VKDWLRKRDTMIVDSRSLPNNKTLETDVCIIGAGTAGITMAKELIGQQFRVCLLESGGLEPDPETQSLYWGENIGLPYFTLDTARARYFGGSSNRWHISIGNSVLGARMRPLDAIDFEERSWIPHSGWPFDKSHLDPYYERAQSICKIKPFTYDLVDFEDSGTTPRLPLNGDRVKTIVFKFGSRDPFIESYPKEIARADNMITYLHANLLEIETDEGVNTVSRLRLGTLNGNMFWIKARVFILACGGIEIPRLLLNSNKQQHAGLGNQNDLVGRFFMEHLHFWSGVFIPSNPDIFNSTALYNSVHRVNGLPIIGKLAFRDHILRKEKMVNHCIQLIPRVGLNTILDPYLYPDISEEAAASAKLLVSKMRGGNIPDDLGGHIRNVLSEIDDLALAVYRKIKRKISGNLNKRRIRLFILAHMSEQVPNPHSRITLSEKRDRFGLNRIKLNWQASPQDIMSAVRAQEIMGEELHGGGLGRLYIKMKDESPPSDLHGGYHHMGTTRMHVDPKKGVVNENCRVHGLSNLYIAGPSVFPTGGYANPVLTIVALTVKLADHLKHVVI
jgi:choline dehydrogenase-like flavoprotein